MPYASQHPASRLRAAFFAKRASMHVYPAEPFGSSGPQKRFNSPHLRRNLLSIGKFFCYGLFFSLIINFLEVRGIEPLTS